MERREPQRLDRIKLAHAGLRARKNGSTPKLDFKLELQENSWLRISLSAKDTQKQFNNLFCHFTVANLREAFHALDGNKAVGIDGITKSNYAKNRDSNLEELVNRLHKGTYRPLPKKGIQIPKANGKTRPIAISSFEDKMVEWVLARILTALYEPIFIRNSFGFRPKKGPHDAIKATYCSLKDNKRPFVVEIDLARFFDTVPHRKLMRLLKLRISDRRFRNLIARFLKAGVLDEVGHLASSDIGTPQGSVMSPVLANVYLHHALDSWFLQNYASKGAVIVRYADDAVFLFEDQDKADRFKSDLTDRMNRYGLTLNEDKSGKISFRKNQDNVFHFVGFTFFWGKDRGTSIKRLKVKTEKKRLLKKIQEFDSWIKEIRGQKKLDHIWNLAAAKLRGHYNYYGVASNRPGLNHFYYAATASLFKWLNRRSQRKSFTWERFSRRLRYNPLPMPPPVASLKHLIDRKTYAF